MAFSRYSRTPILKLGHQQGTSLTIPVIRSALANNTIKTTELVLRGAERLDTLAGSIYGDARYWWIIAIASNIGWCLQVPPGTILKIPDINDIEQLIS